MRYVEVTQAIEGHLSVSHILEMKRKETYQIN